MTSRLRTEHRSRREVKETRGVGTSGSVPVLTKEAVYTMYVFTTFAVGICYAAGKFLLFSLPCFAFILAWGVVMTAYATSVWFRIEDFNLGDAVFKMKCITFGMIGSDVTSLAVGNNHHVYVYWIFILAYEFDVPQKLYTICARRSAQSLLK